MTLKKLLLVLCVIGFAGCQAESEADKRLRLKDERSQKVKSKVDLYQQLRDFVGENAPPYPSVGKYIYVVDSLDDKFSSKGNPVRLTYGDVSTLMKKTGLIPESTQNLDGITDDEIRNRISKEFDGWYESIDAEKKPTNEYGEAAKEELTQSFVSYCDEMRKYQQRLMEIYNGEVHQGFVSQLEQLDSEIEELESQIRKLEGQVDFDKESREEELSEEEMMRQIEKIKQKYPEMAELLPQIDESSGKGEE